MKCELCGRKARASSSLCETCGEMIGRLLVIQKRIESSNEVSLKAVANGAANAAGSAR